jgi:hypothetical protein
MVCRSIWQLELQKMPEEVSSSGKDRRMQHADCANLDDRTDSTTEDKTCRQAFRNAVYNLTMMAGCHDK